MVPNHFRHCLTELLDTELNYVHALEMIINDFAKPLEPLLKENSQLIFSHIKYFHQVHTNFHSNLRRASSRYLLNSSSFNSQRSLGKSEQPNPTTTSNPSTPTAIINFAQQFQNLSPLPSPNVQDSHQQQSHANHVEFFDKNSTNRRHNLKISDCFLRVRDKFLKYGEYCANLSNIQALLDDWVSENEAIASKIEQCQQDANQGRFKLRDLMFLPMQRILKYHLLLAALIKNTNAKNDDYLGLKRAHEAMVDLGHHINEVKRDTKAIQIINEIERSITGLNMPPKTQLIDYGRLVMDGRIRVKFPNDPKSKMSYDKRYIIIFDKVMLICKEEIFRRYTYKDALVLSEFEIDTNPVQIEVMAKQNLKDKFAHSFSLVRSNGETYSFFAKSVEVKNRWIDALCKAFDNIRPSICRNNQTNHEFLMHTFKDGTSCSHCQKLLLGLYYQGYRCRICFASVHQKCLGSVKPCGSNNNTLSPIINYMNEPTSPSARSNCSDEAPNAFRFFPPNLSSSTSCVDEMVKNDYSYIESRLGAINLTNPFQDQDHRRESYDSINEFENEVAHRVSDGKNSMFNDCPWFWGRMEREKAQSLLEGTRNGTYLVRMSPKHNCSYVISLNYNNQVKHMRVYVSRENQLHLSQNRYFKSIGELVKWYENNSLAESFHMLDARLMYPFKGS